MSSAQITFLIVLTGLIAVLTPVLYPGVRTYAKSARHSLLAAFMTSALVAFAAALVVSWLVNVATNGLGGGA